MIPSATETLFSSQMQAEVKLWQTIMFRCASDYFHPVNVKLTALQVNNHFFFVVVLSLFMFLFLLLLFLPFIRR